MQWHRVDRASAWTRRVAVTVLAVLTGCTGSGKAISVRDARISVRQAADPARLDPGPWRPVARPGGVDPVVAERCGDPYASGRMSKSRTDVVSVSPVLVYRPNEFYAQNGLGFGVVRITVARHQHSGSARAAAADPAASALKQCVVDAIRADWFPHQKFSEQESTRETGVPLASDSIEARSSADTDRHTRTRTVTLILPEEMIGGYDNYHDVVETIGRSGPLVASALVVTNSQSGDPHAAEKLGRKLTAAALRRAAKT